MPDDEEARQKALGEDLRQKSLAAARRAVQFLESGQATGIFIVLTDNDKAMMWDMHVSPYDHPMGDCANVLSEAGARLRAAWWNLIADSAGNFLYSVENEDD